MINTLDTEYYFRKGGREIDIILRDDGIIPLEVDETVHERDIIRLRRLTNYINVERGIMVSLNQFTEQKCVEAESFIIWVDCYVFLDNWGYGMVQA